jgi:iron complex outermembrane receptor protein
LSYNALVGAKVDLGHDWELEVNAAHTKVQTDNKGTGGYALAQSVSDIINAGGCNPFDSSVPCNLDGAKYVTSQTMISTMTSTDLKASGELARWGAGSLSLAVGGNIAYQDYKDSYDDHTVNDDVLGSAGSSGGGGRSTRSGYTELSSPLLKPLEFQVAGRYDHYSDFGDTFNPKLALLYHATKSVLLRGSWGTGFKAPLMQDLYAAKSLGYQSIFDHKACDEERAAGGATPDCAVEQYKTTSGGNTDLRAEKSISISVGAMYEPSKDFVVSTDLFQIKNRNRVNLDFEDMTVAESKGINPSDYGVTVVRDHAHNDRIVSIDAPLQNLASQEVTGIDFGASYRMGKFKISTDHSQLFWFKEEGFPGAGLRNKLGERGRPAWRNATALTYNPADRHEMDLIAMTVAGQEKTDPTIGRLSQYTTFDLMYAYQWRNVGTVSLGVKNLLAQAPPVDDTDPTNPVDATIYDVIGRQVYTGLRATF